MSTPSHRVFRVGLTGGIASGKSTVAQLFAALGIPVIDADVVARDVVAPGRPALARISEQFGADMLTPEGALDRRKLRERVFSDAQARANLEQLMHPLIWSAMERRSAELDGPYQLMVIPLLVEKRSTDRVDRVLVVDCDEALQVRRLQSRDQSTSAQAKAILASQATRAERLAKAHDVITNSSDLSALAKQVELLHSRYRALATEARA